MMLIYLISLLIITIVSIFITLFIVYKNKEKRNEYATICGVLWAMIAVFVTLLISIISYKSDDINVIFRDGRNIEIKALDSLVLNKSELKLSNNTFPDYYWGINLCNNGNLASSNIKIKITFDNIVFADGIDYYEVTDGRYALGGYQSLLYDISEIILPDTCVSLPVIDFNNAYIDDNIASDKMTIYIYTENNKLIKEKYTIKFKQKD